MSTIADRIFDGLHSESELESMIDAYGADYERLTFDSYDSSVEFKEVRPDWRMSDELQKVIWDAGFSRCYVNHTDKWETHYSWGREFKILPGWRVSYPSKRGPDASKIWVEEIVPQWTI